MFSPPRLPRLNAGPQPAQTHPQDEWDALGPDDRNVSPTATPTDQLPEDNGFSPPDINGRLPEGVYRRGPLTGPRRERVNTSSPVASTPRAGHMEMSHDGYRSEDDPGLAGLNSRISQMLKRGDSDQTITNYVTSVGINPANLNLSEAFAFRRSPQWQVWRQQRPNDAYPVNIDDRLVPVSRLRQAIAQVGDSTPGAFVLGAADTLTFGHLDEGAAAISAATSDNGQSFGDNYSRNVEDMRIMRDQVATNHPKAYFTGQVAGGLAPWNRFGIGMRGAQGTISASRMAGIGGLNGFLYGWGSGDGEWDQRLLNGTVQGGIGTLLGGATGRYAGRAEQSYLAGREGQDVLDAAAGLNARHNLADPIRPLPAHVGGPMTRRMVGGSEATLFGGRALDEANEAFTRQMQGGVAAVTGTAQPAREVLGEAAAALRSTTNPNGFASLPERALERSSGLYDEAHRLARGAPIQTPEGLNILDDTIARMRNRPGPESPQLAGMVQLRDDLASGTFNVQSLRDLRTRFGTLFDSNDGLQRGLGKRMWGALSDDIDRSLRAAGRADAAGTFRRADTAFRNALGHQERVEALLAGSNEEVAARLISMSRTDSRALRQSLQTMAPEQAEQVRSGLIQMLGRANPGAQDEIGSVFSLQTFLTNFDRIPPEARRSIFPGQMRADLEDLGTLARAARDGGGFRNNSRSGNAINVATIIRGLGAMTTKGGVAFGVAGVPGAAASAAASLALGRLLAQPGFARMFVMAERTGMARSAFIRRLGGFATRNPHVQNDVQVFTDYILSEDVQTPENRPVQTWNDTAPAPEYYEQQNAIANTPEPVAIETQQGTIYVPREVFDGGNSAEDAPQPQQAPVASDGGDLDENGDDWSSLETPN